MPGHCLKTDCEKMYSLLNYAVKGSKHAKFLDELSLFKVSASTCYCRVQYNLFFSAIAIFFFVCLFVC